ncbi:MULTISPECIES: hypothetical protein [Lacticaseibacillus]|uniref:hypothetical protein n=1 Tax=Lacticaseibacillus TaxID=2759736 RepID=UPI00063DA7CE|nr:MULTISPECIES: hypothetical protein [Lacticaseibacillus]KLI75673.1 hypothetical protein AAW28_09260 [Lacticaseibacillus casei]
MTQPNDMVPIQMVNRDGASVVVKPKLGAKVNSKKLRHFFKTALIRLMARIILQELMTHDSRPVQS